MLGLELCKVYICHVKIKFPIKTFNLDTRHGYIWRLNLMTPFVGGVRTGGE